ncbi:MAG: hypothetical protein AAB434_07130 [Planctomycetota bacterium]
MTRCKACGTRYEEVRWVSHHPQGSVRATTRPCPTCDTGVLPRWGVASDLLRETALYGLAAATAAGALWVWLAIGVGCPLRCLWLVVGAVVGLVVGSAPAKIPLFARRWIARSSAWVVLAVAHLAATLGGVTPLEGDLSLRSLALVLLAALDALGPVVWLILAGEFASWTSARLWRAPSLTAAQLRLQLLSRRRPRVDATTTLSAQRSA